MSWSDLRGRLPVVAVVARDDQQLDRGVAGRSGCRGCGPGAAAGVIARRGLECAAATAGALSSATSSSAIGPKTGTAMSGPSVRLQ